MQAIAIARLRRLVATGEARRLREDHHLTYGEVARAVGVGPATVFRWERAERVPRLSPAAFRYLALLDALAADALAAEPAS